MRPRYLLFALFLSFTASLIAQSASVGTMDSVAAIQPPMPAMLVVNLEDDHYVVRISTPYEYTRRRFISRSSNRRDNNRFAGYDWVDMVDRYDLRRLNVLRDSLHRAGWELQDFDHTIIIEDSDVSFYYLEKLVYHYTLPYAPNPNVTRSLTEGLDRMPLLQRAFGANIDETMDLEASLYQNTLSGRQTLIIRQVYQGGEQIRTRLDGLRLLADDRWQVTGMTIGGLDLSFTLTDGTEPVTYYFRQRDGVYFRSPGPDGGGVPRVTLADFAPQTGR